MGADTDRAPCRPPRALLQVLRRETFEWVPSGDHYNDALFHADKAGKISARAATQ